LCCIFFIFQQFTSVLIYKFYKKISKDFFNESIETISTHYSLNPSHYTAFEKIVNPQSVSAHASTPLQSRLAFGINGRRGRWKIVGKMGGIGSRRCSIAAKTKDERKQRNRITVTHYTATHPAPLAFLFENIH